MIDRLLEFIEIDEETERLAGLLSELLVPHLDGVIERFYQKVENFDLSPHITKGTIPILKRKQKDHWIKLLRSSFDEKYLDSVRRIGMRHRDIELNVMWYVVGYMEIKVAFIEIIIGSELPVAMKGQLVKTLEKYIAVDMALALSTYEAVVLD